MADHHIVMKFDRFILFSKGGKIIKILFLSISEKEFSFGNSLLHPNGNDINLWVDHTSN